MKIIFYSEGAIPHFTPVRCFKCFCSAGNIQRGITHTGSSGTYTQRKIQPNMYMMCENKYMHIQSKNKCLPDQRQKHRKEEKKIKEKTKKQKEWYIKTVITHNLSKICFSHLQMPQCIMVLKKTDASFLYLFSRNV